MAGSIVLRFGPFFLDEGNQRLVEETADLWFHTLVLLGARGIPVREVLQELARRHRARQTSPGKA